LRGTVSLPLRLIFKVPTSDAPAYQAGNMIVTAVRQPVISIEVDLDAVPV
jgi:hypothetical protein